MRQAKPHWLGGSTRTWTPPVVFSFDTETSARLSGKAEILTLRCWDGVLRCRGELAGGEDVTVELGGETAAELCDQVERAVEVAGVAWAFAHNLGFDLTVTALPMMLEHRGWSADFVNIGDESCVFAFSRDGARLVLGDSWSWLRCSLAAAARDVRMRKTPLPREDDELADWHRRCRHDARILDRLLSALFDWWDRERLGKFNVTSSSCGWRTLRETVPARSMLVGPDQPRTEFERRAVYGGRKEVWRVGRVSGQLVDDFDLTAAHLTTVANLPLPARPLAAGRLTASLNALAPPDGVGTVCDVRITTRTPCAPCRALDLVWWPVGRFRATVTSAELPHIVEVADRVELVQAYWYWLDLSLAGWGQWCLGLQRQPDHVVPAVVKRVAKGWGRAVPGRFAMRRSTLIREDVATHLGWAIEQGHDLDTGDELEYLTYGGVQRVFRKDQDGPDVSPVVLAFVEGYVRAALGRAIASRPPESMLQCNTDGWWQVRGTFNGKVSTPEVEWPFELALRDSTRDVTVRGPNHVVTPLQRRLAGVPRHARARPDGSFAWNDWPGLRWQLQFSRPGEYVRPAREMMLQDHYCRRWVLATGETVPVTVFCDRRGRNLIAPWSATAGRLPDDRLAALQVSELAGLRDEGERSGPARLRPPARPLGRF